MSRERSDVPFLGEHEGTASSFFKEGGESLEDLGGGEVDFVQEDPLSFSVWVGGWVGG